MYEVAVYNMEEMGKELIFSTFVGIEVESFDDVPFELDCKVLPTNKYAFFTLKGQKMKNWYQDFYKEWLPGSDYEVPMSGEYCYEIVVYEEKRFFGLDSEKLERSEVDILVPISNK